MPPVLVVPDSETALLNNLVERHYAGVFSYIYRLVGQRDQAQDLAGQVFVPARAERRRLARAVDPRAWVYRRATELACSTAGECRRERRWRFAQRAKAEGQPQQPEEPRWGQPGLVDRALAALPFRQRAALLLTGHYGLSLVEAAAALDVSPATLRRLLQAARRSALALYDGTSPLPATALPSDEHEETLAALVGYDELAQEERAGVDTHLEFCRPCAEHAARLNRLGKDLARLPDVWPSRHAEELLLAAVKAPADEVAAESSSRPRLVPRVAVLALIAALAVGGIWLTVAGRFAVQTGPQTGASVETTSTPAPVSTAEAAAATSAPISETLPAGITAADAAWLRKNAIPFNTTEPGTASPADLAPLKQLIGDARVVAFADSAPGSHETMAMKQRLLDYLVTQMNFNTLLVDSSWLQAEPLNDYATLGTGDPDTALLLMTGSYRQLADMKSTLDWLRAYNQDPLSMPKVAVHGFDPEGDYSHLAVDTITQYLEQVDPAAVSRVRGDDQELLQFLMAHRRDYAGKASPAAYNRALRSARALVQYDEYVTTDPSKWPATHSLYQAENVLSFLRGGYGGGNRLILWGSATDLGIDNETPSLGALLRQRLGRGYVVVNLAFSQGSITARTVLPDGELGPTNFHKVPAPAAGSYEEFFGLAGAPRFMLDLRPARRAGLAQSEPANVTAAQIPSFPYYREGAPTILGSFTGDGFGSRGTGEGRNFYYGGSYGGPSGQMNADGSSAAPGVYGTTRAVPSTPGPYFNSRAPSAGATSGLGAEPGPTATPALPSPGTEFLQGPRPAYSIGGSYDDCAPDTAYKPVSLPQTYDVVIFIGDVSPARVLFQQTQLSTLQCEAQAQTGTGVLTP